MTPGRKSDEELQELRDKVDAEIDASIQPRPLSANEIAKRTGAHKTFVARRFLYKGWEMGKGGWVYVGGKVVVE